jgi:hypothetical protein
MITWRDDNIRAGWRSNTNGSGDGQYSGDGDGNWMIRPSNTPDYCYVTWVYSTLGLYGKKDGSGRSPSNNPNK